MAGKGKGLRKRLGDGDASLAQPVAGEGFKVGIAVLPEQGNVISRQARRPTPPESVARMEIIGNTIPHPGVDQLPDHRLCEAGRQSDATVRTNGSDERLERVRENRVLNLHCTKREPLRQPARQTDRLPDNRTDCPPDRLAD